MYTAKLILYLRGKGDGKLRLATCQAGAWQPVFLLLCVIMLLAGAVASLSAQTIIASEYWIDTDPGCGNGTAIPVYSTSGTATRFRANIATSALTPGFHRLLVRAKAADGKWTQVSQQSFIVISSDTQLADLTRAEYFIDTDPGYGAGTAIPLNGTGNNLQHLSFTYNFSSLTEGIHHLMVRVRNSAGQWTLTENRVFYKTVYQPPVYQITAAEYFIDADPGYGLGIPIPGANGTADVQDIHLAVNTAALSAGYHTICMRAKDASGKWTLTQNSRFYRKPDPAALPRITRAEYFIDTDPGVGLATAIPVTSPATDVQDLHLNVPTTALSAGYHSLGIRAKDANGVWTLTQMSRFFRQADPPPLAAITRAEYFIDTDPGVGLGIPIPGANGTSDVQDVHLSISTAALSTGYHSVYIRCCDTAGKWTLSSGRRFYQVPVEPALPQVTQAEFFFDSDPGPGAGIPVTLTNGAVVVPDQSVAANAAALSTGFHSFCLRVKDSRGAWSLTKMDRFYHVPAPTPPLITRAEYFFDTDPGYGQGIPISISPDTTLIASFAADLQTILPGRHKVYVRAKANGWSQTYAKAFTGGSYELETPAQVTGVNVGISLYDAVITWNPVTTSTTGSELTPDVYLVLYNESPFADVDSYYYLSYAYSTNARHIGVARFRSMMFYHVIAMKLSREADLAYLQALDGTRGKLTWGELQNRLEPSTGLAAQGLHPPDKPITDF